MLGQKIAFSLLFFTIGCSGCWKRNDYRHASHSLEGDTLSLRGDYGCKREFMPGNIPVLYLPSGDSWFILWEASYRDASAINRTIVTRVLYATVTDKNLKPYNARPLKITQAEGHFEFRIIEANDGIIVFHREQYGEYNCSFLKIEGNKPEVHRNHCKIHKETLSKGNYYSEPAVVFYKGSVFSLVRDIEKGIQVRKSDSGKDSLVSVIPLSNNNTFEFGNLVVNNSGIYAVIKVKDSSVYYQFAFLKWGSSDWIIKKISGITAEPEKPRYYSSINLFRSDQNFSALIKSGHMFYKVPLNPAFSGEPIAESIIDLARTKPLKLTLNYYSSLIWPNCSKDGCSITVWGDSEKFNYSTNSSKPEPSANNYPDRVCGKSTCVEKVGTGSIKIIKKK